MDLWDLAARCGDDSHNATGIQPPPFIRYVTVLTVVTTLALQVSVAASEPPVDTARLTHDARAAQRRFESVRCMYLPRRLGLDHGSGPCDARIGRFCYWFDSSDKSPPV